MLPQSHQNLSCWCIWAGSCSEAKLALMVAAGGSEVGQLHPLLPPAPLLLFEFSARKPCSLLYQVASIVHPCMLLSSWVFPFVNKQAVRFFTLQGDEGGGGVLGILYWLECQAKVSSASALEEVSKLTVSLVSSHLCSSLPGDICKPVVSPVQLGFQCIPLPLDNCWSCLCV